LKDLQWPLWLPEACYTKGCIHRLANPHKRCTIIVINIGHKVGSVIAHQGRCLIFTIALLVVLYVLYS